MEDVKERLSAYRRRKATQQQAAGLVESLPTEESDAIRTSIPEQPLRHTTVEESAETSPWYTKLLKVALWLVLWGLFIELEFGVVFLVVSMLLFLYISLRGSRRKPWEPSAYSVFNKDCEAIEGTLSAEQFERELRFGPTSVRK